LRDGIVVNHLDDVQSKKYHIFSAGEKQANQIMQNEYNEAFFGMLQDEDVSDKHRKNI